MYNSDEPSQPQDLSDTITLKVMWNIGLLIRIITSNNDTGAHEQKEHATPLP